MVIFRSTAAAALHFPFLLPSSPRSPPLAPRRRSFALFAVCPIDRSQDLCIPNPAAAVECRSPSKLGLADVHPKPPGVSTRKCSAYNISSRPNWSMHATTHARWEAPVVNTGFRREARTSWDPTGPQQWSAAAPVQQPNKTTGESAPSAPDVGDDDLDLEEEEDEPDDGAATPVGRQTVQQAPTPAPPPGPPQPSIPPVHPGAQRATAGPAFQDDSAAGSMLQCATYTCQGPSAGAPLQVVNASASPKQQQTPLASLQPQPLPAILLRRLGRQLRRSPSRWWAGSSKGRCR